MQGYSQPICNREGLGPTPNDMTDFDNSPMGGLTLPEEWMGGDGGSGRAGGRGN